MPSIKIELLHKHLEDILDVLIDGIYISDRHGTTLRINKSYSNLTGIDEKEIIGRNVYSLVTDGVFDTILHPQIMRKKKPAVSIQKIKSNKDVILRGFPVFDEKGEVDLVVTFARDITVLSHFRNLSTDQQKLIDEYQQRIKSMATRQFKEEPILLSRSIQNLTHMLRRIASTDASILLQGETGVGKDLFAHIAHENSPRCEKMFLKVDCGSISQNLIESELFGYTPGAFSGASSKGKIGYFEMAHNGTVFLDEIGELPLPMQAKLLRVLQDHEIMRVGSSKSKKVDVRIIAATNRDLETEVAKGRFRKDLFYRLNVAVIKVPPLRERQEDIAPLVQHFLGYFCAKYQKAIRISEESMECFQCYHWPGNIRELRNLIQSLVITSEREVINPEELPKVLYGKRREEFPAAYPDLENGKSLREIMCAIERDILKKALARHGSVCKVADMFKINRTTIFRKLKDDGSS